MGTKAIRLPVFCMLLGLMAHSAASKAIAQCSDNEMTAVFVLSGVYPISNLQLETLSVFPVGEATYPSDDSVIAAIQAIQSGDHYQLVELVGSFNHFFDEPADIGGVGITDTRDGAIVFAGTVVWNGPGEVTVPVMSSHGWIEKIGYPASEPDSLGVMDNPYWPEAHWWVEEYGSEEGISESVLVYLRQTDVLNSFGECGPYKAVSYIYTPEVAATNPWLSMCVVVVSGLCGSPWNGGPVELEHRSFGGVKGLFR